MCLLLRLPTSLLRLTLHLWLLYMLLCGPPLPSLQAQWKNVPVVSGPFMQLSSTQPSLIPYFQQLVNSTREFAYGKLSPLRLDVALFCHHGHGDYAPIYPCSLTPMLPLTPTPQFPLAASLGKRKAAQIEEEEPPAKLKIRIPPLKVLVGLAKVEAEAGVDVLTQVYGTAHVREIVNMWGAMRILANEDREEQQSLSNNSQEGKRKCRRKGKGPVGWRKDSDGGPKVMLRAGELLSRLLTVFGSKGHDALEVVLAVPMAQTSSERWDTAAKNEPYISMKKLAMKYNTAENTFKDWVHHGHRFNVYPTDHSSSGNENLYYKDLCAFRHYISGCSLGYIQTLNLQYYTPYDVETNNQDKVTKQQRDYTAKAPVATGLEDLESKLCTQHSRGKNKSKSYVEANRSSWADRLLMIKDANGKLMSLAFTVLEQYHQGLEDAIDLIYVVLPGELKEEDSTGENYKYLKGTYCPKGTHPNQLCKDHNWKCNITQQGSHQSAEILKNPARYTLLTRQFTDLFEYLRVALKEFLPEDTVKLSFYVEKLLLHASSPCYPFGGFVINLNVCT
ncbi:hypothetical protein B0H19DRAFT_1061928 [Mycena capillaripes]|nr:hypothetical protein B0H19DRAFT_1061928 [Mycena capillaripes]